MRKAQIQMTAQQDWDPTLLLAQEIEETIQIGSEILSHHASVPIQQRHTPSELRSRFQGAGSLFLKGNPMHHGEGNCRHPRQDPKQNRWRG